MRGHPPLGMFPGGELASLAIQQRERERGRTAIGATEDNARLYNGTFAFVQYWRRNTDTILTTSELHIFRVMSGSVTMLLGSSTFGFPPKLPGTQIWRNWISLQGKWTVREVNAVLYLKQTTSWGTQEEVDLLDTSTHRSSEEHPLVSPEVLPGIQTMAANDPHPELQCHRGGLLASSTNRSPSINVALQLGTQLRPLLGSSKLSRGSFLVYVQSYLNLQPIYGFKLWHQALFIQELNPQINHYLLLELSSIG